MTWEELENDMKYLTPEQKKMDVTVYVRGIEEFYPIAPFMGEAGLENDVLDKGQHYIII